MKAGDRVKLTDKAAKTRSCGYGGKRSRVDWAARVGTLHHFNRTNRHRHTFVIWDGNTAAEQISVDELEVIND